MGLGDDVGRVAVTFVDALTPRSVRMLLLVLVVINGYGWWLHEARLASQSQSLQDYKIEMVGLRADLKAVLRSSDESNAELRAIRAWLMQQNGR